MLAYRRASVASTLLDLADFVLGGLVECGFLESAVVREVEDETVRLVDDGAAADEMQVEDVAADLARAVAGMDAARRRSRIPSRCR